ncbi:phosphatidylinositol N-acetylglucosaminyltransferase subunit P-like [Rhopilema esculentum]|uniref:phosphatidylinositol N-acetylglucosaminyltransferase subunit P-like n=1 Tax=Rhopilema esculentum TaxID=499914 RepID=UPI0031E3F0FE
MSNKQGKKPQTELEHSPAPTPERAIHGFVLYLLTYVAFGFYLLWALVPDNVLHEIGITYLPQRLWIFLGPFLIILAVSLVLFIFLVRNYLETPSWDSIQYLTDDHQVLVDPRSNKIEPVADMHISDVNKMLYIKSKTR